MHDLYLLSNKDLPENWNELADDVNVRSLLGHDHCRQVVHLDSVCQVSDTDSLIVRTRHHDDLVSFLL